MKKFLSMIAGTTVGILLTIAFGFLIVEWASGCGETYTDSKGVVHENACFLIIRSK